MCRGREKAKNPHAKINMTSCRIVSTKVNSEFHKSIGFIFYPDESLYYTAIGYKSGHSRHTVFPEKDYRTISQFPEIFENKFYGALK